MSQAIILDTGVIGLVTNPKQSTQSECCATWLQHHLIAGTNVIVPEIADYELRSELLRANKEKGLERLNELIKYVEYLPICTLAMRQAAQLWAQARQQGQPTTKILM